MATFQIGVRTSNVTTNQAIIEIIAGAVPCRVKTVNISLATGVTGVFGLGRPAAAGVTPTTPLPFLADDGAPGRSQATYALAWGTSPTAPTAYYHRCTVPATVGALRDIMPFNTPRGHGWAVLPGQTLVLFNITGGPTLDLSIGIEE